MLFIAEGQIREPIEPGEHTIAAAWLGPMVDSGLLQAGYLDPAGQRVVLILAAPDHLEIEQRLHDLPVVRDQKVRFTVTQVTALRFT